MNYMEIKYNNVANGPGVRTSLFVSGCSHACPGCFNQEAWSSKAGLLFTEDVKNEILNSLSKTYVDGLTLLGGEPFMGYNVPELISLCQTVKELYPKKTIWAYSGWTFDELILKEQNVELLKLCDVLVDGRWEESLYSPKLRFRGSGNQRIIDLQQTFKQDMIVLSKYNNKI